jgi:hypothetical protein
MKRYDNPYIGQVWRQASTALTQAERIVCIGCSFRESDNALIQLLKSSARTPAGDQREVILVTRSVNDLWRQRAQAIFGSYRVYEGGFATFLTATSNSRMEPTRV